MIPDTILSASEGEEKNGSSVGFAIKLLAVELLIIVFSLVTF